MKVEISKDELYPCYSVYPEGESFWGPDSLWGNELDISEELYERIRAAENEFYETQQILRKL